MKDLATMLATSTPPPVLPVATPESFRAQPVGAPAGWQALPPSSPPPQLKLYQPVHGRFYLVAASLVCQLPGLPDRGVHKASGEKVSFVLRKFDGTNEYAWAVDPNATAAPDAPVAKTWLQVPATAVPALVSGEDTLPMFPVLYPEGGRRRHVHVGLIPTSNRETYQSTAAPPPVSQTGDPRVLQFENRVLSPFDQLTTPSPAPFVSGGTYAAGALVMNDDPLRVYACKGGGFDASSAGPTGISPSILVGGLTWTYVGPADAPPDTDTLQYEQSVRSTASAFLLLDFADLLSEYLPSVWNAIQPSGTAPPSTDPALPLYTALTTQLADTDGAVTWSAAILSTWQASGLFNGDQQGTLPAVPDLSRSAIPGGRQDPTSLRSLVTAALGSTSASSSTPPPAALVVPKTDASPTTLYRVRCVFSRPACGPLAPDILSDPTDTFAIAQYYDYDAPQRPIRIPLPVDTTVAGLRKFTPSVGFIIAKQLRAQMARVVDLKKILDGNLANSSDPGLALGEICSFSIPIITLCALLVLMIFVSLLNIVFWWMPFLKICLPVPEEE
jgi:hypothetical protein